MVTIVIEKKHLIGFAAIVALALVFSSLADVNTYAPWHFLQQVAKGPHGAPDANRSIDENNDGIVDAAQNLSCGGGTCYVDGSLHVNNTLYVNGTLVFSDGTTQNTVGGGGSGDGSITRDYQVHAGETIHAGEMTRLMSGKAAPDTSHEYQVPDLWGSPSGAFAVDEGVISMTATNLSDGRFAVAYVRSYQLGNTYRKLRLRVGKVEGDSITYGNSFEIQDACTSCLDEKPSITAISADKIALLYDNDVNGNAGMKIVICRISDVSANCGTPVNINDINLMTAAVAAPREDQILILAGRHGGGSNYFYNLRTGSVSDLDVSLGSWVESAGYGGRITQLIPIGTDSFVFAAYNFNTDGKYGIGRISPSLQMDNTYDISAVNDDIWQVSMSVLSSTLGIINFKYAIPWTGTTRNAYLALRINTSTHSIQSTLVDNIHTSALEGKNYRLVEMGSGASWNMDESFRLNLLVNQSKILACAMGGALVSVNAPDKFVFICYNNGFINGMVLQTGPYLGFAQSSGTGGSSVAVTLEGLSGSHTNLLPLGIYYYDTRSGNITLTPEPWHYTVGRAISSTELWVTNPPLEWK